MKPRSSTLKALIATYAVLLTYLPVSAADLPPGPLPRTPVAAPVPYYNWTGFYVGVNGGGAWGSQDPWNIVTNRFDHFSTNISGGVVGGTIGAQIQASHVVMGLEADLDWLTSEAPPLDYQRLGAPGAPGVRLVPKARLLPPSNPDAHSFRATPLARPRLFPPDPIQQRELHLDL